MITVITNFLKNGFSFNVNWAIVLSCIFFWVYGLFGFLTVDTWGVVINVILSVVFLAIFLFIFSFRNNEHFISPIQVTGMDIKVLLGYCAVMFALSYKDLLLPLDGDQLYHAQQSVMHGITAVQLLGSYSTFFDGISFSLLVWVLNGILLVLGTASYFFLKGKKRLYTIVTLASLFLISRLVVLYFGGNASAFPTFRLFPIWFSELIFSPSNFGFRIATFVGLIVLMWFVQRKAYEKISFVFSLALGLVIGTIPVLWHVGTLVELSLWSAICFILVLFWIHDWCEGKKLNYLVIISSVVILSTMRVSAFITLVPIFIMMVLDYKNNIVTKNVLYRIIPPILVLLPILFASFYLGAPSTYTGEMSLDPYIRADASLFERLVILFQSEGVITYMYNSLRFPLIFFLLVLPCAFVKNVKRGVLVSVLFVLGFILFYSINPIFWGHGRYQAEYLAPFVVFGVYLFSIWLYKKNKYVAFFVVVVLTIINIYFYKHIQELNQATHGQDMYAVAIKERGQYFVLSEFPYNTNEALQVAKEDGYAGQIYYMSGNGYGYFSQILSGYSVAEMKKGKEIVSSLGDEITAREIDENKKIQLVLVNGSPKNKEALPQKLADELRGLGWVSWRDFSNNEYGTTLYGIRRK